MYVDGSITVGFGKYFCGCGCDCFVATNHGVGGSFGLSLSPLAASIPKRPPDRDMSIGERTLHASWSASAIVRGWVTNRSP